MCKCKQNLNSSLFRNVFTSTVKTKYALLQNESPIQEHLCRTNFSQYSNSYRGPYLWDKIAISKKIIFSDSDSLQAFKPKVKRFLLSVELNELEILK